MQGKRHDRSTVGNAGTLSLSLFSLSLSEFTSTASAISPFQLFAAISEAFGNPEQVQFGCLVLHWIGMVLLPYACVDRGSGA
jgi:hypothetical protein